MSPLRSGLSRLEVLVGMAVVLLLATLAIPWILHARELSRRNYCADRMGHLGMALIHYEQEHKVYPMAAEWSTSALRGLALHQSKRWDQFIGKNWAIDLSPYLGHAELLSGYDPSQQISADQNRSVREQRLDAWACPIDEFNRQDNPFLFEPTPGQVIPFARGNYAINGGTHSFNTSSGNTSSPTGDHAHLQIDSKQRQFQFWGNGIAGFNKAFRYEEFVNGTATLVAFNEIRSGIDPIDIRGSWALGHIAASVTWGHGINGDAYCPNNLWARSDDIQNGGALNEKYGPDRLIELGMPCVSYLDTNQNAGSRSRHAGGVNTTFLDGSVRFVSDRIDPAVWHYLHSRETPPFEFHLKIKELVDWAGSHEEAVPPVRSPSIPADTLTNSLGMSFVKFPAGEFQMGIPDFGNHSDSPSETPQHKVRITADFLMGTTEVTEEQFQQVMSAARENGGGQPVSPGLPAVNVTWYAAREFCERLSSLPEERAGGRTYRLPTEAEWEYACREMSAEPFRWTSHRLSNDLSGMAAGMSPPLPLSPVGSYPANSFGLFDMRGNAWEWCADWFDRDYYGRSPQENPSGPQIGYAKVVRGADWIYVGEGCYINYPILAPWKSSPYVGFRVVCVPTSVSATRMDSMHSQALISRSETKHEP